MQQSIYYKYSFLYEWISFCLWPRMNLCKKYIVNQTNTMQWFSLLKNNKHYKVLSSLGRSVHQKNSLNRPTSSSGLFPQKMGESEAKSSLRSRRRKGQGIGRKGKRGGGGDPSLFPFSLSPTPPLFVSATLATKNLPFDPFSLTCQ